jgi:hypothetical protein
MWELRRLTTLQGSTACYRHSFNVTAICEPTVYIMWERRRLTTLQGSTACYRDSFNVTAICEPTIYIMWEPRRLTNLHGSTACYRDSFKVTAICEPTVYIMWEPRRLTTLWASTPVTEMTLFISNVYPRLPTVPFLSEFHTKTFVCTSLPCLLHATSTLTSLT